MDSSAFIENLKQLFAECDTDNNGCLGQDEFRELCNRIGLNRETADETFARLDIDKNGSITFDEFAAGFQQYKQTSSPQPKASTSAASDTPTDTPIRPRASSSTNTSNRPSQMVPQGSKSPLSEKKSSPSRGNPSNSLASRARKSASPLGVISLGSSSASGNSSSTTGTPNTSSSSGTQCITSSGNDSSYELNVSSDDFHRSNSAYGAIASSSSIKDAGDVVIYSSDALPQSESGAGNSGTFGSLVSGGSGSFNNSQLRTMQDLLDCVQKLQSENQVLSQIFFKDKREREEYINQLGEEFDQQVREVEERANRRAKEELESEKKRLREMMQAERETLEHHYQTIEKMSKLIESPDRKKLLGDSDQIDNVKSKLEDTFLENRQLKKSLLDTKSDVAMIRREMNKLKLQYEDRLSSAYEKNNETRSECDHLKQQINLMKDSNRKLQDASDMITSYITDKVEPVIKNAEEDYYLNPSSAGALLTNGSSNRLGLAGSQTNSRRGSILSEYLGNGEQPNSIDGFNASTHSGDVESLGSSLGGSRFTAREGVDDRLTGSSSRPGSNLRNSTNDDHGSKGSHPNLLRHNITTNSISEELSSGDYQKFAQKQAQEQESKIKAGNFGDEEKRNEQNTSPSSNGKSSTIRNLGRHFFIGSRAQSDVDLSSSKEGDKKKDSAKTAILTKSISVDQPVEPSVEPADGPSKATFNIILVGDSFVGKSSFAARFMEGNFVQGLISNCSIDFKTKAYKVDGVNYTINLWDTAGQERFRSITASYFRKADGIILMYDVTEKRSYLNVRNWMSTISDTASENVAVLLIGNKIDLRSKDNKEKCVPTEEGFRLAKEYDIVFLETSVKNGTNLVPSMGKLIKLIAKNNVPEEDKDRIKLSGKNRTFACMPKNC